MRSYRFILALIAALLASTVALAQYVAGTTPMLAPVAPAAETDTYPSHLERFGEGGFRSVDNTTARDAIPAARLKIGMLVQCIDTGTIYRLDATTNWVDSGIKSATDWIGTNVLTLSSAAGMRSAAAVGEWATNANFGIQNDYGWMRFDTAAGDTTKVGLRYGYGATNVGLLSVDTTTGALELTDSEGTTPTLVTSPGPATVVNFTTLTNEVSTNPSAWRSRLGLSGGLPDGLLATSSAAQEAAALGETELYAADAEPLTFTGWTTNGVDWAGFNHASGGGTDPLTLAVGEATGTHTYLLTYTVVGTASGSSYAVMASIGNSIPQSPYNGGAVAQTFTEGLLSISDGNLVFTPVNTFAGYITNISLRRAENSIAPVLALKNSNGDSVIEMRSDNSLNNTFVGENAGSKNITGKSSVAVGAGALKNNVSGFWQTAVGAGALENSISGTRNVAVGLSALNALTTGQRNTAVGDMSGRAITTGNWNTLVGKDTGYALTTASNAVALGYYALGNHRGGNNNIGIGQNAGYGVASSSGHNNIFIGQNAGFDFTDADSSVVVGDGAGFNLETGDYNTLLGAYSGRYITTGAGNTFIGHYTGHSPSVSNERSSVDDYCVFIGKSARRATDRPSSTKLTGAVAIGYNAMVGLDYNIVLGGTGSYAASVAVGATNAAPSAVMDLTSTTKGFLLPRMTTAQREAISSPAEGLAVWDLTLHKVYYWDATHWTNGW